MDYKRKFTRNYSDCEWRILLPIYLESIGIVAIRSLIFYGYIYAFNRMGLANGFIMQLVVAALAAKTTGFIIRVSGRDSYDTARALVNVVFGTIEIVRRCGKLITGGQ